MKKYQLFYSIIFALLISIQMMGQQKKVIVGYGETYETIASKYGVTVSELLSVNPGKDICYIGMEIVIPQPGKSPLGDQDVTSVVLLRADSMLIKAKEISKSGNYRKAIKLYNRVLDMKVRTPYAYAGLGECFFGLNKLKKARKNLNMAIYSDEIASVEKEWCIEALKDVDNGIEAKRQKRKEIWSKIGLSVAYVAAVTATTYAVSQQAKTQNQYNQNTMPVGYGSDHLKNADQIIAQSNAINNQMRARGTYQLNMMTQNTYVNFEQQSQRLKEATMEQYKWRGEYEKEHGYPPTEMEVIQWYQQHYPDLTDNYIQSLGALYEATHPEEKEKEPEYKGNLSPENYQQAYRRWEHVAESHFNGLTVLGGKYEDKNGKTKGYTGDMNSMGVMGISSNLRDAQREMRKIRLEAAKHGVVIAESKWETISPKIGY